MNTQFNILIGGAYTNFDSLVHALCTHCLQFIHYTIFCTHRQTDEPHSSTCHLYTGSLVAVACPPCNRSIRLYLLVVCTHRFSMSSTSDAAAAADVCVFVLSQGRVECMSTCCSSTPAPATGEHQNSYHDHISVFDSNKMFVDHPVVSVAYRRQRRRRQGDLLANSSTLFLSLSLSLHIIALYPITGHFVSLGHAPMPCNENGYP